MKNWMFHTRYLATPFTQLPWASPTHYFISYPGSLWEIGDPFSCKTDKAWAHTVFKECVQLIMKKRIKTIRFLNYHFSFSLCGRRTQFSWTLTSWTRMNLLNPSGCYHRNCPTKIKPVTKSFPTILSYCRKGMQICWFSYTFLLIGNKYF